LLELKAFTSAQRSYSGLPLVNDTCPTHLRLYPSQSMEEEYITNSPLLFTVGAVIIFVFTSAVFVLYDWMVEQRQRKVMATAVQTSAIVSSLFPSTVRDRLLFASNDNSTFRQNNGIESWFFTKDIGGGRSRPIADFYPNATVMFADM
jgi:hypothetical protein